VEAGKVVLLDHHDAAPPFCQSGSAARTRRPPSDDQSVVHTAQYAAAIPRLYTRCSFGRLDFELPWQ
jgi:hypothetical protein